MATKEEMKLIEKIVRAKIKLEETRMLVSSPDLVKDGEVKTASFEIALVLAQKRVNLTQTQLAVALHISRTHFAVLQSGKKRPSLDLLAKLYLFFQSCGFSSPELLELIFLALKLPVPRLFVDNGVIDSVLGDLSF